MTWSGRAECRTHDGEEEERQRLAALLLVAQHDLIDGPALELVFPSFMPFSQWRDTRRISVHLCEADGSACVRWIAQRLEIGRRTRIHDAMLAHPTALASRACPSVDLIREGSALCRSTQQDTRWRRTVHPVGRIVGSRRSRRRQARECVDRGSGGARGGENGDDESDEGQCSAARECPCHVVGAAGVRVGYTRKATIGRMGTGRERGAGRLNAGCPRRPSIESPAINSALYSIDALLRRPKTT